MSESSLLGVGSSSSSGGGFLSVDTMSSGLRCGPKVTLDGAIHGFQKQSVILNHLAWRGPVRLGSIQVENEAQLYFS